MCSSRAACSPLGGAVHSTRAPPHLAQDPEPGDSGGDEAEPAAYRRQRPCPQGSVRGPGHCRLPSTSRAGGSAAAPRPHVQRHRGWMRRLLAWPSLALPLSSMHRPPHRPRHPRMLSCPPQPLRLERWPPRRRPRYTSSRPARHAAPLPRTPPASHDRCRRRRRRRCRAAVAQPPRRRPVPPWRPRRRPAGSRSAPRRYRRSQLGAAGRRRRRSARRIVGHPPSPTGRTASGQRFFLISWAWNLTSAMVCV